MAYTQERLENISHIMPTYAAFLKPGDRVKMGMVEDPLFPEVYRNARPLGVVESIVGPEGSEVINVKLDDAFGGKMAHCDVLSVNPYLTFELEEATYQNALVRSRENPSVARRVRAQHDETDVTFRGMFQGHNTSGTNVPSSVSDRLARMEGEFKTFRNSVQRDIEQTRETTVKAFMSVYKDIENNSNGEPSYSGSMLKALQGDKTKAAADDSVHFRGLSEGFSSSSEDSDASFDDV